MSGLVVAPLLLVGCGDTIVSPIQPTPPPAAQALPSFSVTGSVTDTANRPLGGARVEVLSGPRAGVFAISGENAHFSLPGTFTGTITLVTSKHGYVSQSRTVPPSLPPDRLPPPVEGAQWSAAFQLEPDGPSLNLTGVYSVTLTIAGACDILPAEARRRTYTASVAPFGRPAYFQATLSDARFFVMEPCPPGWPAGLCTHNRFGIGIAGDFVGISAGFIERIGEAGYLVFSGVAEGTFGPSGITTPLHAELQYCQGEPYLIDQGTWACQPGTGTWCSSSDHQLALTRR